jgi:hypothetical protein
MKVKIRLKNTSQQIEYEKVINTYEKGQFYCLYLDNETVKKFPIIELFDITEDYGEHP